MVRFGVVASLIAFLLSPLLVLLTEPLKSATDAVAEQVLDLGRGAGWCAGIVLLSLVLLALGLAMKDRALGVLIDRRNRYSLSRLQILLWTLLVLPTLYITLGGNVLRAWGLGGTPLAVDIDWSLVALMGLSIGSFVAAPMALSIKSGQESEPAEEKRSIFAAANREDQDLTGYRVEGKLLKRTDPDEAILSDLLRGEEVGNAETLDLARIQMLVITFIVWITFATQLSDVLFHLGRETWILKKLPGFDATLLALVLVSHGGYLAGKVVPNSTPIRDRVARELASLNEVGMRAAALASGIGSHLEKATSSTWVIDQLRQLLFEAKKVSADAQGLNSRIGAGEVVGDEVARLNGRLDALEGAFRMMQAPQPGVPKDVPAQGLVQTIKNGLRRAGYDPKNNSAEWDADAERALDGFLEKQGVMRLSLPKALNERLEMIESLVSEP